jgi:hypothetical protein
MDTAGGSAQVIQGYEIVETLGQGGFGTVYRARQLAVGREVALKIDGRVLATERDKRRFMREVTAAGQLSGHPHVVAVYDAGVLGDGRPYMVLELCPGGSLADRLRDKGPFPPAEVRDIGVNIADALGAAHAAGVLHRDVKPANILVNQYGGVALADFGLAVIPTSGTESSATREALTPAYASPEVFNMAEPTVAGDIYALGATLYALLSGRPPYFPPGQSPGMMALIAARLRPVPDIPDAPPGLVAVLRWAMAYDAAERPSGAVALRDALAAADLSLAGGGGYRPAPPASGPVSSSGPAPGPGPVAGPDPMQGPAAVPGSGQAVAMAGAREGFTGPPTGPRAGAPNPFGSTTAPATGRRSGLNTPLLIAAIVVAVSIVTAGGLISYSIAGGSGKGDGSTSAAASGTAGSSNSSDTQAKDRYAGAEITSQNCPAAGVRGADARCTKTAECWSGIVSINGNVSINRSDCVIGHAYETFAIAPLPADGQTWNEHTLEEHPIVRQVCSRDVMARSRYGGALKYPPSKWSIEVIPPSEAQFDAGLRTFRCVASVTGKQVTGSVFRPRA